MNDDFYVGYLPKAPAGLAKNVKRIVLALLLIGLAVAAVVIAAVPLFAIWPGHPSWIDPHENRYARWTVYAGGVLALALFIVLSPR